MLESLAIVLKIAFEIILATVIFKLVIEKMGYKKVAPLLSGIIGSLTIAGIIIHGFDFFGDREIFDAVLAVSSILITLILCVKARKVIRDKKTNYTGSEIVTSLVLVGCILLITLGKAIELELFVSNIFMMNKVVNSDLILKLSGVLLAVIISLLLMVMLLRVKKWLSDKALLNFIYLYTAVLVFRYLITVLQTLFATGILPLTPWALAIISPLINTYYPAFFYVVFGTTFLQWYFTRLRLSQNKPNTTSVTNPAVKRKLLANFIKENNWVIALGTSLAFVSLILLSNTVLANRKEKLDPPTPVTASNGVIDIPIKQIEDYNLHRFSYTSSDNVNVRFIVIRKGEKIYGSGLDACEICGEAGYYQRGKDIICKNCDVVINIPTIGFPGGCNPIPLKNKNSGDKLSINVADLEAKADVFTK